MAERLIALDMLARSDARGLERAIQSARPHVDEVIVGVDGRSDAETREVTEAYADVVWTFNALDIGLSEDEWQADKIHFANARNLGRARVSASWTLFLDSDEFLTCEEDLRAVVERAPPDVEAFEIKVQDRQGTSEYWDHQRLARSGLRWSSPSHNQLNVEGGVGRVEAVVTHDTSLRSEAERRRREAQRNAGVSLLVKAADSGDVAAFFHLAKHKLNEGDFSVATGFLAAVNGPDSAVYRAHLGTLAAILCWNRDEDDDAERWCKSVLVEESGLGESAAALCLLGEIAYMRGDDELATARWLAASQLPSCRLDFPELRALARKELGRGNR